MTDYKCDPTKWTNMKAPVDGGRDTYQAKSWNPPKEKWGPFTKKGAPKVWFAEANATNWTESMICKAKDLQYVFVPFITNGPEQSGYR